MLSIPFDSIAEIYAEFAHQFSSCFSMQQPSLPHCYALLLLIRLPKDADAEIHVQTEATNCSRLSCALSSYSSMSGCASVLSVSTVYDSHLLHFLRLRSCS